MSRLHDIIKETTQEFRKGAEMVERTSGAVTIVDIYMMDEVPAETSLEMIDMWFIKVGVDKDKALQHRAELVDLLNKWEGHPLTGGLSYISFGATLGSQDLALRLMALGKALDFWEIITPSLLHMTGAKADQLAGSGFIMATGYQPNITRDGQVS